MFSNLDVQSGLEIVGKLITWRLLGTLPGYCEKKLIFFAFFWNQLKQKWVLQLTDVVPHPVKVPMTPDPTNSDP